MGANQALNQGTGEPVLAVGVGCSSRVEAGALVRLVHQTLARFGLSPAHVAAIATLDAKASSPAAQAANDLGAPLVTFPPQVLAAVDGVQTRSLRVAAAVGTPSVAEAAALAALGQGARLVVPRQVGPGCTCAVAGRCAAPKDAIAARAGQP